MDYLNNTTKQRKHKHLNFEERMIIQIRLIDGYSKYKIAKELNRSINTISNEIKRGTVTQIKQGKKVQSYYADTGQNTYRNNRKNSRLKFKRLMCNKFLTYVSSQIKEHKWSVDVCVGYALLTGLFIRDEINEIHKLSKEFGDGFTKVFKSITSDNGLEFSELYNLKSQYGIKVYFTHIHMFPMKRVVMNVQWLIKTFCP